MHIQAILWIFYEFCGIYKMKVKMLNQCTVEMYPFLEKNNIWQTWFITYYILYIGESVRIFSKYDTIITLNSNVFLFEKL